MTGVETYVAGPGFAAANDNRKVEEGYIPIVAFVIFTATAAAFLLTLPNWYLSI